MIVNTGIGVGLGMSASLAAGTAVGQAADAMGMYFTTGVVVAILGFAITATIKVVRWLDADVAWKAKTTRKLDVLHEAMKTRPCMKGECPISDWPSDTGSPATGP